ncbi:enoyl-CoA hydratase-related protein [Halocella sp. SP3-1]|uniref:enoyl-CoA hydratase-related protein n=1 Tax=Halocella sp. SP3-1 TaxID=2382161 RepID=UPI000F7582E9|nr:enoyl-CoA hydratase-related protein [Halocella sp. SP3-1]AZO96378.1 crotonase [Halocella sp. SP3-1]
MAWKNIIVEKEDKIGYITINRPKSLNALNHNVLEELKKAFIQLDNDEDVRVLIITGAGEKAFVAGADINELEDISAIDAFEFMEYGQNIFNILEKLDTPSIASVNGYALGGGLELAMACDLRVAAKNAKFGQPEIKLANIPGWGGIQRLTRYIGITKAKEMVLTGNFISAEEALQIGLVNNVLPKDKVFNETKKLAETIAAKAPLAIKFAKKMLHGGLDGDLSTGLLLEAAGVGLCCSTIDQTEGVEAFLQKRDPKFCGK